MPIPVPGRARIKVVRESRRSASGQLRSSHHPGDGDPDHDADQNRDPEYSMAVEDKLGVIDGHPFKILQVYLTGKE